MSMNQTTLKTSDERFLAAIDLVYQSVAKVDNEVRVEAKELDCYSELLTVRTMILAELDNIRGNV